MPRRTRQKLSLGLLATAMILGSFNPVSASRDKPPSGGTEQRAPFFDALPWGSVPDSPVLVRRLAENPHPLSTERLLEAADANEKSTNFLLRLALVEALHARTRGSRRDEVVRRLVRIFREVNSIATPSTKESQLKTSLAEQDRVRGSAALALAHSGHREALMTLFALAATDHPADRHGKELALMALSAVPQAQAALLRLGFKKKQVDRRLAPPTTPLDGKVTSPVALTRLAEEPARWVAAISQLASLDEIPREFLNPEAWVESFAQSPVWSLRALTCLSATAIPELQKLAIKTAKRQGDSVDVPLKLTALWTLSISDSGQTSPPFSSTDDETLAVLLRQSFHGPRATEAALFSAAQPGRPQVFRATAMSVSLLDPTTWSHHSDRDLWALEGDSFATKEWIAPLTSRALPMRGPVSPSAIEQLDHWLKSDSPYVRSAAVRGLGISNSTSALGLLLKAYRRELDPRVRRAICQSLARHRASLPQLIVQISELDPDSSCRSLILSQSFVKGTGFFVGWTKEDQLWATDRFARQVPLIPAIDGFVGVVGNSF